MKERLKNIIYIIIFSVIAFGGLVHNAYAQSFETRLPISFEKELTKTIELKLTPELRLSDGLSTREYLLEGGITLKPIKYIHFSSLYRLDMQKNSSNVLDYQHRYFFDAELRYGLSRFDLRARTMFTNDGEASFLEGETNNYLRYRLKTKYNIRSCKLSPFASAEYFYQINDKEFNKSRYSLGLQYKIKKSHSVKLQYSLQSYLKKDKSLSILSIGYKYKF
jgi:hypothetical protein